MPYKLPESPTPPDDTSENASELGDFPERESLANNLPNELIILIMSYISSSKDLRSCSTVCRLWTYAAQCRLFSVLTIEIPSEVKSWTKRFKESPHIRHAVTSLDLSLPIQRCTDRLLTKLLRKLPNVKGVRLECWDAAQVYRLKVLKGLESLVLYEVAEGDLVFVTRGIKKMEYLKKLEVSVDSGVTWTPSLLSKIGPVKAVKLKELAVMVYDDFEADEAQSVGHMLDWLNSIVFDHSELETLKLAWEDVLVWDQDPAGMETEKLVKLLESVNPRLSNLVLTLPDYQYDQSDEESDSEMITLDPCLDYLVISKALSRFSSVRTFTIQPSPEGYLELSNGLEKARLLLETLQNSNVDEIHLYFDLLRASAWIEVNDQLENLEALDRLFEGPPGGNTSPMFPGLKEVHLHFHSFRERILYEDPSNELRHDIFELIEVALSELNERDLLRIDILGPRHDWYDGGSEILDRMTC